MKMIWLERGTKPYLLLFEKATTSNDAIQITQSCYGHTLNKQFPVKMHMKIFQFSKTVQIKKKKHTIYKMCYLFKSEPHLATHSEDGKSLLSGSDNCVCSLEREFLRKLFALSCFQRAPSQTVNTPVALSFLT